MKVAFGMKAHSGWAALIVLGTERGELRVVDRRRMELVGKDDESWAKQPYHAAEDLSADEARDLVGRGLASARRIAVREVRTAAERAREEGHEVVACAVLMGDPMPDWTVDEILAVHFRMHKAEEASRVKRTIASLGKSVGPPWGKDQKDAALAALIALHGEGG